MDSSCYIPRFSEAQKERVRKEVGTDKESLKRDVEILKEWLKKEPHLPQDDCDDAFLECFLLTCKCRVEKAKETIDLYYKSRTVWPDMYESLPKIVPSKWNVRAIPLIPVKDDLIIFADVKSPDHEIYRAEDFCDILVSTWEILMRLEYSTRVCVVIDYKNFGLHHLVKLTPFLMHKIQKVILGSYSARISALHFYNTQTWLSMLMALIKPVLPAKIFERIKVHDSLETLTEIIPKDLLPKDHGGNGKSIDEYMELMDEVYNVHHQYLVNATKVKSNERLRVGKLDQDVEIFGTEGTFKKLNLD